jgi:hypothetical protein
MSPVIAVLCGSANAVRERETLNERSGRSHVWPVLLVAALVGCTYNEVESAYADRAQILAAGMAGPGGLFPALPSSAHDFRLLVDVDMGAAQACFSVDTSDIGEMRSILKAASAARLGARTLPAPRTLGGFGPVRAWWPKELASSPAQELYELPQGGPLQTVLTILPSGRVCVVRWPRRDA